ncbi:hypothetical protein LEM8419_02278 [Neolewinella maritima]|uniref:DNA-protecting protein DprA n=1 Tax=Neolewinella maritima TaxID=1383882 RepID=A0ABM9B1Z8_9BACT|nr:DNA-processing protein DprA [Neolewinella maritima]CAH1001376.1 hypothetical protein LEM8419_02278 [Neolewinella maritima]
MTSEQYAAVALSRVPAIGAKLYRTLIRQFGSARAALAAPSADLRAVEGIAAKTAAHFGGDQHYREADRVEQFARTHPLQILCFGEDAYPDALTAFESAPAVLYHYGQTDWSNPHPLAIIGTRKMSSYGGRQVERLVDPLQEMGALIISGLAYGIDITAHRRALRVGLPTVAVLGSGFEHIYPAAHRRTARQLAEQGGGLLSEYVPWQTPEREHFPARNRIVAMLAAMTVVVESSCSGGSLITAKMARDYGKPVGACPGRPGDPSTAGCNELIKSGRAHLIEAADDVTRLLKWGGTAQQAAQLKLFDLEVEEQEVVQQVPVGGSISIDELQRQLVRPPAALAGTLLMLEMKGILTALPGHRYRLAMA